MNRLLVCALAAALATGCESGTEPGDETERPLDPQLIAQGRDNGNRVCFFRLLPKAPTTDARASTPGEP